MRLGLVLAVALAGAFAAQTESVQNWAIQGLQMIDGEIDATARRIKRL